MNVPTRHHGSGKVHLLLTAVEKTEPKAEPVRMGEGPKKTNMNQMSEVKVVGYQIMQFDQSTVLRVDW